MDRCEECGFVYEDLPTDRVAGLLRELAGDYAKLFADPRQAAVLATRPATGVWSALEYACHVRDVILIQRERVLLALVEDTPSFPQMHREERVILAGYATESVDEVIEELLVAANLLAKPFQIVSPESLGRRCIYNYPSPTERDVAWLGRHTIHEAMHHLRDIRSGIEPLSGL